MKRTLLRNIFSDDARLHDKKLKFIEERVNVVDQNFPELKNRTSDYTSKKSAEKKCIDKIVTVLMNYSEAESVSASAKGSVEKFAKILSEVGGEDETLVRAMSEGVIEDFAEFGKKCKHLRSDIKTATSAADKELIRQRQLQRLEMLRDQDQERISCAEADVIKARNESAKALKTLEEHADLFELNKLQNLKSALLKWTTLELRYHARCLELFTDAYRAAAQINVSSDHEEFRYKLHGTISNTRPASGRGISIDIGSSLEISSSSLKR